MCFSGSALPLSTWLKSSDILIQQEGLDSSTWQGYSATSAARAVTPSTEASNERGSTSQTHQSSCITNCFQTKISVQNLSPVTIPTSAFSTVGHLGTTIKQTHMLLLLTSLALVVQQFTLKYESFLLPREKRLSA